MYQGGIGYIPYSEISSWLDENHITDSEERCEYRFYINYVDRKYVENTNENLQLKIKAAKNNARK